MKKWSFKRVAESYRLEFIVAVCVLLTAILYNLHLGSLPPHMSNDELLTFQNNKSLSNILHSLLNAPYNFIDYAILHTFGIHTLRNARITSVIYAVLAIFMFFCIMIKWHGKRTAWMATILFATSSWLLHIGRLGTANILWINISLTLILLGTWLVKTERSGTAIITLSVILGLMLFIPASIWFVIAFIIVTSKTVLDHFQNAMPWQRLASIALILFFIATLVFSLYRSPDSVRIWLGLPQVFPSYISMLKLWLSSIILYPFFRGPAVPEIWLGHTPILDVFTATMYLIGAHFYFTHYRNLRTRLLGIFILAGSVLTALNGPMAMSFIVPVYYLIAATGITFMLHQWMTVFPKNPIARFVGVTLITVAISSTVGYHLVSYFVAWQHNPPAVATFQRNP